MRMPELTDLRDQACIVGIGETDYTRGTPKSALELALEDHPSRADPGSGSLLRPRIHGIIRSVPIILGTCSGE